jgi:phosphoglycerate dehydrogenase-like enzyme
VSPVSRLAEVLGDARYVVLCVPLTPATRGLFDTAMLARLRPDAFVVNVSRGGVVDEMALVAALGAGRLAGAALDVLEVEPLPPDSPLWTTRNLVITPHIAGLGERYIERCVDALVANVAALATGVPRTGLVNRDVGY